MRPLLPILVASALLLISIPSSAQSQKHSPKKNKRESAVKTDGSEKHDSETQALLSAIKAEQASIDGLVRTIKEQSAAEQKKEHADDKPFPFLGWLTALRVQQGLLIVGFLYTAFALWQLIEIHRQANIATQTLRVAYRAMIGVKAINVDIARKPKVSAILENYGHGAARNLRPQLRAYLDTEPPNRTNYLAQEPYLPQHVQRVIAELMPGVPCVVPFDIDKEFPDEAIEGIEGKRIFVYVLGQVFYNDGFGDAEVPLFCYWLNVDSGLMSPVWR